MNTDRKAKQKAIADLIDGKVIDDAGRVAVCIKGTVMGFPLTLEAIYPNWPFNVTYTMETNLVTDPSIAPGSYESAKITLYPRMGRGLLGIVTKIVLFEARGQAVGDKHLQDIFNFSYDNREIAEWFIRYQNVGTQLVALEQASKFSELVIKTDRGVFLAQPTCFDSLSLDDCQATFNSLGQLTQIVAEAFEGVQ